MAQRGDRIGKKKVTEAIRLAEGNVSAAARALGCRRQTVHEYIARDSEVRAVYDEANETVMDVVENQLIEQAKAGDREQIRFYLRTKGRTRGYGDRMEHSGPNDGPIQHAARIEIINTPQPPPE